MVYFPEATHVAMYVGQGMVIQAPRTGEKVKVSPLATYPVLGAVRPDGGRPDGGQPDDDQAGGDQAPATEAR